jgi:hypothetical protein
MVRSRRTWRVSRKKKKPTHGHRTCQRRTTTRGIRLKHRTPTCRWSTQRRDTSQRRRTGFALGIVLVELLTDFQPASARDLVDDLSGAISVFANEGRGERATRPPLCLAEGLERIATMQCIPHLMLYEEPKARGLDTSASGRAVRSSSNASSSVLGSSAARKRRRADKAKFEWPMPILEVLSAVASDLTLQHAHVRNSPKGRDLICC